jgi:hypothetical protein
MVLFLSLDFDQGERHVLLARLVDRALRPLFAIDHLLETQVYPPHLLRYAIILSYKR